MKYLIIPLSLIALFILSSFRSATTGTLVIRFDNCQPAKGAIEVTVFDNKRYFLKKGKSIANKRVEIRDDEVYVEFHGLPYGDYALASYHDINGNNRFDRNMVGLPKEPYAFSKKFKSKIRRPRFKEVAFQLNKPQETVNMEFMWY